MVIYGFLHKLVISGVINAIIFLQTEAYKIILESVHQFSDGSSFWTLLHESSKKIFLGSDINFLQHHCCSVAVKVDVTAQKDSFRMFMQKRLKTGTVRKLVHLLYIC